MEEIFFEESTKQLSKLLFEITKNIGLTFLNGLKSKHKDIEDYFNSISAKYLKRFDQRYGTIQILGMNKPMSLSNVFVDVKILGQTESSKRETINDLKKEFEKNKDTLRSLQFNNTHKIDGMTIINDIDRLMIVGPPGGGKSTFLRKIGIESLNTKNEKLNKYLPILIELKNISLNQDITSLIEEELKLANFHDPSKFLEESLKKGKLIVLFDGLDEVPPELENRTINDIRNFCDKYVDNKFVVSCRIASYQGGLSDFNKVEIANFDKRQIEEFITKWFKEKTNNELGNKKSSSKCWETINSLEYESTLELAQTPLLLTLLCLVYNYQQDFPKNRALLYHEAINVLLKEWNAEKRIHGDAVYKDMTLPFEELLLANLAHHYFVKNEYFFEKNELSRFISEYICDNLNAPKFLDGSKILNAISVQQGILIERAKNIYSFSHLTFQEYYTARYIDEQGLIDYFVENYLFETRWREIFILLCGIMKAGSDKLINKIYSHSVQALIDQSKFRQLLKHTYLPEQKSEVDVKLLNLLIILIYGTNYPLIRSLQRSYLIILFSELNKTLYKDILDSWILDAKPYIDGHFERYVDFCGKYEVKSKPIKVLNNCMKKCSKEEFENSLKQEFCNGMGVKLLSFSENEIDLINTFFQNILYLYQCKNASVVLSRKNWNRIESEILTGSI